MAEGKRQAFAVIVAVGWSSKELSRFTKNRQSVVAQEVDAPSLEQYRQTI